VPPGTQSAFTVMFSGRLGFGLFWVDRFLVRSFLVRSFLVGRFWFRRFFLGLSERMLSSVREMWQMSLAVKGLGMQAGTHWTRRPTNGGSHSTIINC
jgi:hypothetical protein